MSQRTGLLANLQRIRAQNVLDMARAINLVMSGDINELGQLQVQAGVNAKKVSKWAEEQNRLRIEQKLAQKKGFE